MRRFTTAALGALTLWSATADAQTHPGGLVAGGGYPSARIHREGTFVFSKTQSLTYTTIFTENAPGNYNPGGWWQTAMDVDNRSYVHVTGICCNYNPGHGVFRFDPTTQKATTIFQSRNDVQWGYGLVVTQDGDYLALAESNTSGDWRVYRADGTGAYTTVLQSAAIGATASFFSAMGRDAATGDVVFATDGTPGSPVLALRNDGTVRTFASGVPATFSLPAPSTGLPQQLATGDLYYLEPRNLRDGSRLWRIAKNGARSTIGGRVDVGGSYLAYSAIFENQSIANPQLIVHCHFDTTGNRFVWLDPSNGFVRTKTIDTVQTGTRASTFAEDGTLLHDRSNYVQTVRRGPLVWDIRMSVPTMPGKAYALVASQSGFSPGISVDSRKIWLNPDLTTAFTAFNTFPSIFNGGPGTLDANGEALGRWDFSSLGLPPGYELLFHTVLLVLDPSAPSGIAFITEPTVLRVKA